MKLTKATQQDLAYCAKLSIANMTPYYERWGEVVLTEAQWYAAMSGVDVYLVTNDVGPVGYVSVQPDPKDPKAMFLVEIQVGDGYRGEGVFKSIRPYIRRLMKDGGFTAITGSVHRDNPLVAFYEQIGYHKVDITPTRYSIRKDFTAEQLQGI